MAPVWVSISICRIGPRPILLEVRVPIPSLSKSASLTKGFRPYRTSIHQACRLHRRPCPRCCPCRRCPCPAIHWDQWERHLAHLNPIVVKVNSGPTKRSSRTLSLPTVTLRTEPEGIPVRKCDLIAAAGAERNGIAPLLAVTA